MSDETFWVRLFEKLLRYPALWTLYKALDWLPERPAYVLVCPECRTHFRVVVGSPVPEEAKYLIRGYACSNNERLRLRGIQEA